MNKRIRHFQVNVCYEKIKVNWDRGTEDKIWVCRGKGMVFSSLSPSITSIMDGCRTRWQSLKSNWEKDMSVWEWIKQLENIWFREFVIARE